MAKIKVEDISYLEDDEEEDEEDDSYILEQGDSILKQEDSILEQDDSNMEGDESYGEQFVSYELEDDTGSIPASEDAEWREDASVPTGWKVKEFLTKAGQRLEHVQSPSGVFFPGRKAAMEWMREQGDSQEDIELMQSKLKIRWREDDPSVPPGWKTRTSQIRSRTGITEMQWFLSPQGKMYRGRKAVLKHIKTEPSLFTQREVNIFKSVPLQVKKFSAEYDWREDDPTVPPGWRSAVVQMNSFGKMVESTRYLAPDGRFCTSRVEAIKYLMLDETAKKGELAKMKKGLIADGWMTDAKLPKGWYMKPDRCRGKRKEAHYNYLSEDCQYYRSTKAAIAFLTSCPKYNQKHIDNLLQLTEAEGKKLRPDKYDWQEGGESVPDGWKIRTVMCSNGLEREFFLAPDGSSFSGRKQALEFMKKSKSASEEDIRRMESGCKVVWSTEDPTLPPGWKFRESVINSRAGKVPMQWFLSPDGKMFRGRKSALEEIQSNGKYSKQDIRKFKFVIPDNKKTNYVWNSEDPTVPDGWMTTVITMNSFGKMVRSKRFMAPDGRFCTSRDDALKFMLKEGLYEDDEIQLMQEGFGEDLEQEASFTEGWGMDSSSFEESPEKSTPRARKRKASPLTVVITKIAKTEHDIKEEAVSDTEEEEAAAWCIKRELKYEKGDDEDEEEEEKDDRRRRRDKKDAEFVVRLPRNTASRVKSEEVEDDECYQLRGWRSGRRVSRVSLGQVKEEPGMGKDEGWVEDDPTVPAGWKTKEYKNKGGQKVKHVMSPSGQFFAGRKAALEHMESTQEYSQGDIELMQSGLKIIWLEDDPTIPEGWKTRTTEVKTKTGLTQMQWFQSPEGRLFRGRKSALKFIETCGRYTKEDIKAFKSRPAADKKFTKEYDWRSDDPTVPAGWKSTVIFMNSFGKMVRSLRFLAPDGRFCTNRIDALRYMAKEGIYTPEDMLRMKNGLLEEGWKADDKLPAGWFMKPRKDKVNEATASYHYVSDTFQQFDSTKAAVRFLMDHPEKYAQEDISKLEMKVVDEAKKLCPDKYDWLEDDTVPPGWKYRTVLCSNGLERHFFLAPDGSSYSGRKQAVDYMKKINASQEDIRKMESGFKVKWDVDEPSLPPGWKTRTTDMKTKNGKVAMQWFLSPEGKMFRGKKSALEFITNSGKYDNEIIRKFRCSGDATPNKSNYDWDEADASVPPGWKSTQVAVNSFGKIVMSKRYLSPDGRFCSSRLDALRYMVKERIFADTDVEQMKAGLYVDGWELDPVHLPPGWLVKPDRHKDEDATFNYLTPDFQFLRSTRAAQAFMKNSPLYTADDVMKVNALVNEGRKRIRVDKYVGGGSSSKNGTAEANEAEAPADTVPEGWKMRRKSGQPAEIVAPDGAVFESRSAALRHMVLSGYSAEEQEEMRGYLRHEGWTDSPQLPTGWKMISRSEEDLEENDAATDYTFLTPSGEILDSIEAAVEHLVDNGAPEAEVKCLHGLQQQDVMNGGGGSRSRLAAKYDWVEDETVPVGWKTRVVEGRMKKKFFLAPDGSSFACRRSGLQHMIREGFPPAAIAEMKAKLCHEGWEEVDFLPAGWQLRKSEGSSSSSSNGAYDVVDYWFLAPDGTHFKSSKTVVEYMLNSEEYSQDDVDRILGRLDSERRQARQLKYDWIQGDQTVPPGWKLRVVEGKTRKTFFLSEDGCQFACRRSALQHLINSGAPEVAVEAMRSMLRYEGWLDDPMLPSGWKVRKAEGSTNGMFDVNYYYLAKDGTMFHSTRAVINFMKKSPAYTETDIGRIKARLESEIRKNRPQKYVWLEDPMLPAGWRYRTIIKAGIRTDFVLTEAGAQYQSRRAAIEQMIKDNFPPQAIFRLWSTLDVEGWVTDDGLPRGWRIRSKDRIKDNWQFYFLSPQMETFKSNKAVLDFISSQPDTYSTEDFQKVKAWIEEEQRARRGEHYTWQTEPNLPQGWKVRSVVTNSRNIREFFLTPNGDQIAGRKKAIEVMRQLNVDKRIIDAQLKKMKQVSQKNQNKRASAEEAADWHVAAYNSSDEEAELEDMQMFEEEESSNHIDLSGMVPEFEPVEITAYDMPDDEDVDEEDDEEFNDVEEITDEVLESEPGVDIKSEPDIAGFMTQHMETP